MKKKRLHIFRAGTHTPTSGGSLNFSEADLAATVRAYDPKLHEAPFVCGHPKHDDPAQGWVSACFAEADGLFVEPRQVDPTFAENVAKGRFKKISAAFYPPDHPTNPVPGVYYLRHVGFLGAMPPAVKGLQPVEFADDGTGLAVIEFGEWTDGTTGRALRGLREWLIGKFGLEEANKAMPSWYADALVEASVTPDPETTSSPHFAESEPTAVEQQIMKTADEIKAAQDKLKEAQEKLAADQVAFAEREQKAAAEASRRAAVEFTEGLAKAGKIASSQKARIVEVLAAIGGLGVELEFAEGDQTVKAAPLNVLQDFLTALPQQIEFGEISRNDKGDPIDTKDAKALAAAATEFVESEGKAGRVISIAQAMDHVTQHAAD